MVYFFIPIPDCITHMIVMFKSGGGSTNIMFYFEFHSYYYKKREKGAAESSRSPSVDVSNSTSVDGLDGLPSVDTHHLSSIDTPYGVWYLQLSLTFLHMI